jgi:NAD(P)-dependent dehydrogenase (short-subunit alcohol dehydrogenase family)
MRLSGKVSIVTGASAGLGASVAARFAREGSSVVAADTKEPDGVALVEHLRSQGLDASFIRTDISNEESVKYLIDAVLARYGRIDVLFNNAAILLSGRDLPAHEITMETWDLVMGVNLRGPLLCAKHTIPSMLRQGAGSIVNVSSRTGIYGCAPQLTAYSASKAAVIGLTRVMAAAYARAGIRVNSIVPGTMDTPMNGYLFADDGTRDRYREAVPMGRLGTGADIEGLAVYLASNESAYCTGGLYMCDGGATAV